MKRWIYIAMVLAFLTITVGCASTNVDDSTSLSSDAYPMEYAKINTYKNDEFHIKVTSWEFVDANMIFIEAEDGRTFLVDKVNVTFFSLKD